MQGSPLGFTRLVWTDLKLHNFYLIVPYKIALTQTLLKAFSYHDDHDGVIIPSRLWSVPKWPNDEARKTFIGTYFTSLSVSVTRLGIISPLWHTVKRLWPFWKHPFCIWHNFVLNLANFTCYRANFHCYKWQNIEQTFRLIWSQCFLFG